MFRESQGLFSSMSQLFLTVLDMPALDEDIDPAKTTLRRNSTVPELTTRACRHEYLRSATCQKSFASCVPRHACLIGRYGLSSEPACERLPRL